MSIGSTDYPDRARWLGLDPGTHHLGWAVMDVVWSTSQLLWVDAGTLEAQHYAENDLVVERYGTRTANIDHLIVQLDHLIATLDPDVIMVERPFYHRFRPAAFEALVEVLTRIQLSARAHCPYREFIGYEPRMIKKTIGVQDIHHKQAVRTVLLNHAELATVLARPLSSLDEHAIDAIAICLTHRIKNMLPHPS